MFEPSKIDILTSIAEGTGHQESVSAVRALTVRLPLHVYAAVQALAELSSTTKGAMIASLVEAAADQVSSNLSPARYKQFAELQSQVCTELFQQGEAGHIETERTSMGAE